MVLENRGGDGVWVAPIGTPPPTINESPGAGWTKTDLRPDQVTVSISAADIGARIYSVHEIFGPTIQGEGAMAGVPCMFLRLSLCNMWSGRPEHLAQSQCWYCDTDFNNRIPMSAGDIVRGLWADIPVGVSWVWISGGEPSIQVDYDLLARIKSVLGVKIGMETNGSYRLDPEVRRLIDHLVISPKKARQDIRLVEADSLKMLYPHTNPWIRPENFEDFPCETKYLQPIDPPGDPVGRDSNTRLTIQKLYGLPGWRLSIQAHKLIGVP